MTSRSTEYESYALLSNDERESFEFEYEGDNSSGAHKQARSARPRSQDRCAALPWVFALLVVVAAADGITLLYMSRIMNTVYADLSTDELEFANPYHGLDALYRSGTIDSSKIDPIQNIPRVVAQIFPGRPKELAPVGEHDLFNKAFGTLSPHEKHLQVSPSVHTIAQFRALDFGMEECSLVIQLPGNGDRIESKEPFLFHPLSALDVFRLDAPKPLDVRKLSYTTRPPRKEKIATVTPRAGGETPVTRFPCVWGSLHTFEVACSSASDCLVDIWSSQNTTYGIYMYQHQTV